MNEMQKSGITIFKEFKNPHFWTNWTKKKLCKRTADFNIKRNNCLFSVFFSIDRKHLSARPLVAKSQKQKRKRKRKEMKKQKAEAGMHYLDFKCNNIIDLIYRFLSFSFSLFVIIFPLCFFL
jgi:hypothetical protein